MKQIGILKNPVQEYAWGSLTAIPELLGVENEPARPQAELWMGAHPKAPSKVRVEGRWVSLVDLIKAEPAAILGQAAVRRFGPSMPYLFKVLAAAEPLSIQAHPDRGRARKGFARENGLGIPLEDPRRNYKDDNHKPECICAISRFIALCGFRRRDAMAADFSRLCPQSLSGEIADLTAGRAEEGLKTFFVALMELPLRRRREAIQEAVTKARQWQREAGPRSANCRWLIRLAGDYPEDIGVFSPFILNLVELAPGEALFLPAGELHSYLDGTGIELMANSDNVLRGGLTAKHVDAVELISILSFEEREVSPIIPVPGRECEQVYLTPAEEFELSAIEVADGRIYTSGDERGIEILICTGGEATLADQHGREEVRLSRGMSAMIPAAHPGYRISGRALIHKASVP